MRRLSRRAAGAMLLLGLVPTAQADKLQDGYKACRTLSDASARLACFDDLMPTPEVAPQGTAAAQVQVTPPPAPATAAGSFGSEAIRKEQKDEGPTSMQARLVGTIETLSKGQRYSLDNGQVWLNINDRDVYANVQNPEVTIEKNFVGSYWMLLDKPSARIRVRRIK